MLLIPSHWCGHRPEPEFTCAGEAHIARPCDPNAVDDEGWADYLFNRTNPKGWHAEQWCHSSGCRQWFNVERHTVTYEIRRVYHIGEPKQVEDDVG